MANQSFKDFPPVDLGLAKMQAQIASDQGEVIWRQDLAALGERVFDLDLYKCGPSADVDGQGVALRQLHLASHGLGWWRAMKRNALPSQP